MSDMRSMDRENKKRQLRQNIVQMPPPEPAERDDEVKITRHRRKKLLVAFVTLFFVAAIGFCGYRYLHEYEYTEYTVQWEKAMRYGDGGADRTENGANQKHDASQPESGPGANGQGMENGEKPENSTGTENGASAEAGETKAPESGKNVGESSFIRYVVFGDNMLKYTKDGASYIDASGKTIWTQGYEMKTPAVNVNGDYAVIADIQGNEIYICNKEGCTGVAKTQLPITKAAVSAKGVAAAVVEDSTASYIFYFKKNGDNLGINIKMLLSGDGYPVDIALSPDGKQIAMSVMYMKNGALKNKVVFYDFSEIGKNVNNRFIGAFEEEFEGKMAARVRYLNEETVCAFSDKGLTFISVKNVIPDPNVVSVPVEEEIESICYTDRYAAVVVDNPSGNPNRMDIYTADGSLAGSLEFDYPYSGVLIDGERVILYNEESCRVYNLDGHKKFEGQFDFAVSMVRSGKGGGNSLILAGSETMKEIRLK